MKEVSHVRTYDGDGEVKESSYLCCKVPDLVKDRYQFSNYLVNPNWRDWVEVIRVAAIVLRYIKVLKERVSLRKDGGQPKDLNKPMVKFLPLILSEEEVAKSETYFFQSSTREVKKFV